MNMAGDSWFNNLLTAGDAVEEKPGVSGLKSYVGRLGRMQALMDAVRASTAAATAASTGTCPAYPVDVQEDKVTITTMPGCQIVIRLSGARVSGIDGVNADVNVLRRGDNDDDNDDNDEDDGDDLKAGQHVTRRSVEVAYVSNLK